MQSKPINNIVMNTLKFEKVYSDHYPTILKFVKTKVYPHLEVAEEITNDVFMKVFNHLESYDENKGMLSTWIGNIAKNTLIDYFRAIKLEKESKINFLDSKHHTDMLYSLSNDDCTDGEMIYSETMTKVRKGIALLDEAMQKVAELRYFKQYKYKEIAEELNIPMGTVKIHIHRIQNHLVKFAQ